MKTKKPKVIPKVIPKAILLKKLAIASRVIKDRRLQIGNMQKEITKLKDEATVYNMDVGLVTIPEYEQRLEDYRFKVATMQAIIESLQIPELPVGIKPVSEVKLTRWQYFLKALGFNGQ